VCARSSRELEALRDIHLPELPPETVAVVAIRGNSFVERKIVQVGPALERAEPNRRRVVAEAAFNP